MAKGPIKVAVVQAAPVFLDLQGGVAKTIDLMREASAAGAKLITFPECWLPGYPWWVWLDSPAWGMRFVGRHFENCMSADGPETAQIAKVAAELGIWVVMGYSERAAGSLYIAQLIIDDAGTIVAARRKLKATHVERTVFGEGDGSDIKVHETAIGNLGALCCWEHINPLTKYAMYAQNEQIHVGSWPSFSIYPGAAYALSPQVNLAASQIYAVEGQCFVLAPCGIVSPEMLEMLCDTPTKHELLKLGGGYAMIFGPDGAPLVEPLAPDAEGILYADIDVGMIAYAKAAADPTGHYARPDVARLLFNPAQSPRVQRFGNSSVDRNMATAFTTEPSEPNSEDALESNSMRIL